MSPKVSPGGLRVHRFTSLKLYESSMIVNQTLDLADFVHRLVGWLSFASTRPYNKDTTSRTAFAGSRRDKITFFLVVASLTHDKSSQAFAVRVVLREFPLHEDSPRKTRTVLSVAMTKKKS